MKCLQSIKLFYFEGRKATFLNQNISEFFLTTYKHKNVMNPQSCTIISFQNDFLFRQFEKNQGYPMKIFFNSQIQCCFFSPLVNQGAKYLKCHLINTAPKRPLQKLEVLQQRSRFFRSLKWNLFVPPGFITPHICYSAMDKLRNFHKFQQTIKLTVLRTSGEMLCRLAPKFSLSLPLHFAESYFPLLVIGFSKKLLLPNTFRNNNLCYKN